MNEQVDFIGPGARVLTGELWLCQDCTMLHVNGEFDPCSSPEEDSHRAEKLAELGPGLTCNDGPGGRDDFSTSPCDGCGDHAHGERHRFALLRPA